jgi:hypothetical protein
MRNRWGALGVLNIVFSRRGVRGWLSLSLVRLLSLVESNFMKSLLSPQPLRRASAPPQRYYESANSFLSSTCIILAAGVLAVGLCCVERLRAPPGAARLWSCGCGDAVRACATTASFGLCIWGV